MINKKRRFRRKKGAVCCVLSGVLWITAGYFAKDQDKSRDCYESLSEIAWYGRETMPGDSTGVVPWCEENRLPEAGAVPVNFQALKAVNSDVVGWIKIDGTSIDYPIVQGDDNQFYLDRDFTGEENPEGAVYLDFGCSPNFSGKHNILYGHNMKSGRMFGELNRYKDREFFQAHRDIAVYTPGKVISLKVFAVAVTDASGKQRRTEFLTQGDFQNYVEEITAACLFRSMPEGGVSALYSLVTCSYEFEDARTIVYACPAPEE